MSIVDIAMATYNGEEYLEEQLESIIAQSFTNWRLFVRDDLSTDNTLNIIKKYVKRDNRINLINDDLGNLKVSRNFEEALKYCDAPYLMFADQDDVWFADKIEKSISTIKNLEKDNKPILVFANSLLVSKNLDLIQGSNYNLKDAPKLSNFLFANAGYQGSTMIFNQALKKMLYPFFPNSKVHDFHVSIAALLFGEVHHIKKPLMYYRRHDKTTSEKNITLRERFLSILNKTASLYDEKLISYLREFILYHNETIHEKEKNVIHDYMQIVNAETNLISKLNLVRRNNFTLRNSRVYLILKIIMLK